MTAYSQNQGRFVNVHLLFMLGSFNRKAGYGRQMMETKQKFLRPGIEKGMANAANFCNHKWREK